MALSSTANLLARIKIMAAGDDAFTNKDFELVLNIDQTVEEANHDRQKIDGVVTDKAVSLGGVTTPTFIFVKITSKFDGAGGTTEDDAAVVQIKIDGGTAFDCNQFLLAVDDTVSDQVTSTITYTTLANTDTIVDTYVVGRSA